MTTVERARRIRGSALQLLALFTRIGSDGKRGAIPTVDLRGWMGKFPDPTDEEFEQALAYLDGKKYIEIERYESSTVRRITGGGLAVLITSLGIDVVDSTIADKGIDLGGRPV